MPISFKLLKATKNMAAGATNVMYSAGPTNSAIVSNIRFYNGTGASTNVDLTVTKGGTAAKIARVPVQNGSVAVFNTEITLNSTEKVEANTSVVLDCVVCGVERT